MTAWLAEHVVAYGASGILAAVLLLPAPEAALPVAGTLMPGQPAVVLGGMLARRAHLTVEAALLAAFAGAVPGTVIGYAVGRRRHERILAPLREHRRHGAYTARAPGLIRRHGGLAVFVGRFTAVPRTLVPTLCGATRMPLRRCVLWSVVSGAVRGPAFVLLGCLIGPAGPG
ncbi:VTT domain-containing protein [Streptomyces sp. NPDC038707]|uniref:DedA family protein n=1 Tax=Streptomyces sp. NPDC038707 TaxID=3154329 RepID=UPI0033C98D74